MIIFEVQGKFPKYDVDIKITDIRDDGRFILNWKGDIITDATDYTPEMAFNALMASLNKLFYEMK